ncbi:1-aminocyclopropane-1-carboxylate deaminase/D-cysteine desulfhydrase [Poritiphilus flavus]|uniref:Pyridoxal-phosphate dependent enzyme n=1 Tax=Poritiphilus flavus TaxID=2697053 RepID=A0A6L9EI89_9FLAO|nr:pyridoxal-phosphate dependent enzyme [Poritiphilus flavus]NAS14376.1 pyridoxal-phosphate dependent enzyme [Poritiphilus flavus]
MKAEVQKIQLPILEQKSISLQIKREDLLYPALSGNKYRKLKYNLLSAREQGHEQLLTFGGAYSNHIAATARAGKDNGIKTIGIIRGEELVSAWEQNPTLKKARQDGMQFKFVSRTTYRERHDPAFHARLRAEFGKYYLLPEGGTNELAIRGCEEILSDEDKEFNVVCCSVGTGGTLAGIVNSSWEHQLILGFPALAGDFLNKDIRKFTAGNNWELQQDYHFGGYARVNKELVLFINNFYSQTKIPLDPVYTGKMMFGILDLIRKDFFAAHTKILAIHTGGLQGIDGMNTKLKMKNLPLIEV